MERKLRPRSTRSNDARARPEAGINVGDSSKRARQIVAALRAQRSARDIAGQRRVGITPRTEQLGLSLEVLRTIAREHRRDHALALALWETKVHDARLLAVLVDDPRQLTAVQMERWARDFDSWALVDGACIHLFRHSPLALAKARVWMRRRDEFVRRAGFVLIATLAVHGRGLADEIFLQVLPEIRRAATDDRNFVKKAVNWALRQIGKRHPRLRRAAIAEAQRILTLGTPTARWIARDALRELHRPRRPHFAAPREVKNSFRQPRAPRAPGPTGPRRPGPLSPNS